MTHMFYQSAGGLPVRSSSAAIRELLAEGTLSKQTLVWAAGQRDWAPLEAVASQLLSTSLPHLVEAANSTELTVSPRHRGHRGSSAIWAVTDEISPHGHNIRERPSPESGVLGLVFTGERLKVRARHSGWLQVQWGQMDAWVLAKDGQRRFLLPTCTQDEVPGQPRPKPLRTSSGEPLDRLFYSHGAAGAERRPVKSTVRELRALLESRSLDRTVMVWTSDMDEWKTLQEAEPFLQQLADARSEATKGPGAEVERQQFEAACLLQASWRGHHTRSQLAEEADTRAQEDGARLLQAQWRGHSARKRTGAMRVHKLQQEEEQAATVLQSRFRGHNTRRTLRAEQRRRRKAQYSTRSPVAFAASAPHSESSAFVPPPPPPPPPPSQDDGFGAPPPPPPPPPPLGSS
jgi:hypothetical protein